MEGKQNLSQLAPPFSGQAPSSLLRSEEQNEECRHRQTKSGCLPLFWGPNRGRERVLPAAQRTGPISCFHRFLPLFFQHHLYCFLAGSGEGGQRKSKARFLLLLLSTPHTHTHTGSLRQGWGDDLSGLFSRGPVRTPVRLLTLANRRGMA